MDNKGVTYSEPNREGKEGTKRRGEKNLRANLRAPAETLGKHHGNYSAWDRALNHHNALDEGIYRQQPRQQ